MKLKRLKHQSYILCHMFCGWQLYPDWERLAELGNGSLEIDLLNETCMFNSAEIPRLSISEVLRDWLLQDLASNGIPLERIESARLKVELRVGIDKKAKVPSYNRHFVLEGTIVGDGRRFRTTLEDKAGRQRIIASQQEDLRRPSSSQTRKSSK